MELTETERVGILRDLLDALRPEIGARDVAEATWRRHSNDVGRVELDDGRVLMVKVGRFDWAAPRFRAERRAARWLRGQGIVAPEHLATPERVRGRPVLCYWRIPLRTLATVWAGQPAASKRMALRDWGTLLRRVHAVAVDGYGPLATASSRESGLGEHLATDLDERLRPAVAGQWPGGLPSLDRALETLPALADRVGGARPVLLHGDPHAGNVMCSTNGAVRCEGLIDLETAAGGPPELDLAHALVLHGPHFAQPLADGWFEELRRGYGLELDAFALRWFAVYHMLNLGFYSALVGDQEHATSVAHAAAERADGLIA